MPVVIDPLTARPFPAPIDPAGPRQITRARRLQWTCLFNRMTHAAAARRKWRRNALPVGVWRLSGAW